MILDIAQFCQYLTFLAYLNKNKKALKGTVEFLEIEN